MTLLQFIVLCFVGVINFLASLSAYQFASLPFFVVGLIMIGAAIKRRIAVGKIDSDVTLDILCSGIFLWIAAKLWS